MRQWMVRISLHLVHRSSRHQSTPQHPTLILAMETSRHQTTLFYQLVVPSYWTSDFNTNVERFQFKRFTQWPTPSLEKMLKIRFPKYYRCTQYSCPVDGSIYASIYWTRESYVAEQTSVSMQLASVEHGGTTSLSEFISLGLASSNHLAHRIGLAFAW